MLLKQSIDWKYGWFPVDDATYLNFAVHAPIPRVALNVRLFCISALFLSAAFGQDNVVTSPAVRAQSSKFYANARQSFVPTTNGHAQKTELSFTLGADGSPSLVSS